VEQLLATKLFIPAIRPELVSRSRLIEQLNTSLSGKLTLISAPAGFGKTTLVCEWVDNLQKQELSADYKIAWLSLDESDNTLLRFLAYLITALNQSGSSDKSFGNSALDMLQSPHAPRYEIVLTTLINEIAALPNKLILVLDDYHLIETQLIHDALCFLLDNIPPQLHLVIITREDPLLPLSRLRVRGQLTELRAADLRFTSPEAAEFLNQTMSLNLSQDDVAALETRTEGWVAGLQLAAISMQGQKEPAKLIQAFTGSNRLVLDYLVDEVLHQQPPAIQDFLLDTAVLGRLSGPLCDAVRFGDGQPGTGQEKGQAILERLERANLFVIPLDNERQWYRYHHLFADLLRQRLRQIKPELESILHSRASVWCEGEALTEDAVEHALQAGDFERSAALIAELADELWKSGEHPKLRGWLEKLTEEWVCTQPQLCIYHAWFLFSTGHQESAERFLLAAEQALDTDITTSSQSQLILGPGRAQLKGRLSAIRALALSWGKDFPAMIQEASAALELLPKDDPWCSMAELVLGDAYFYKGDIQASYQTRLKTLEACQPKDDLFFFMISNLKIATSLSEMGQLEAAIEICRRQLDFARQHGLTQTIFAGWAMGLLGVTLAERNEFEDALEFTSKYVELTKDNDLGFVGSSYMFRAKVQFYMGDYEGADITLKELADIGKKHYLPHYISGRLKAWQARLNLIQNRLEAVNHLIEESDQNTEKGISLIYDDIVVVRARLLLLQGNYQQASQILESLIEPTQAGGSTTRLIEVLALLALVKHAAGEAFSAIQYLTCALSLAEPGGYVRVFVDEGPQMARLLYEALSQGIASNYVQHLLAAFPSTKGEQPESRKTQIVDGRLIEPLSERELEILQLIADGLTNQEIGSNLYLSLNTVKAHTRNIYGKLGINSRTQAVARARALGILSAA
jgi:LuxR family maltose regulon positive regulatory protein